MQVELGLPSKKEPTTHRNRSCIHECSPMRSHAKTLTSTYFQGQLRDKKPPRPVPTTGSQVPAAARNPSADQQDSDQRRLDRLEWLCFDDKCNRLDALSCSSTLVSFFTRIHVSWADISPSCSHLMLDSSAGDIKSRLGGNNLRNPAW